MKGCKEGELLCTRPPSKLSGSRVIIWFNARILSRWPGFDYLPGKKTHKKDQRPPVGLYNEVDLQT